MRKEDELLMKVVEELSYISSVECDCWDGCGYCYGSVQSRAKDLLVEIKAYLTKFDRSTDNLTSFLNGLTKEELTKLMFMVDNRNQKDKTDEA